MLVYDGNCGFCARWVDRIRAASGDTVEFAPSQEVGHRFPQISPEQFENAVQWIGPDGEVYSGARAALCVLAFTGPTGRLLWWSYRRMPWFAGAAEAAYRLVARNRKTVSTVSRWLWGQDLRRPDYRTSAILFLRTLAAIYLIGFLSFWVQAHGLIGAQGILPIEESLRQAAEAGHPLRFPTLFWFDRSDTFIHVLCGAGTLLAVAAALVPACGLFLPVDVDRLPLHCDGRRPISVVPMGRPAPRSRSARRVSRAMETSRRGRAHLHPHASSPGSIAGFCSASCSPQALSSLPAETRPGVT